MLDDSIHALFGFFSASHHNGMGLQAQAEAINLLAGQKTNENPENTVGILTLAGKGPRVLVTPTSDLGKILGAMHDLGMEGETNICSGVQVGKKIQHFETTSLYRLFEPIT